MIALKIEDLKTFTAQLFMGETFDHWLVREVNIVTFNSFTIDGRIRQGYYSDEELEFLSFRRQKNKKSENGE